MNNMNRTQATRLGEEMGREQKSFQVEVMKRFMTDTEYNNFLRAYKQNTKSHWTKNREDSLSEDVSAEDLRIVRAYLLDTNIPVRELAEKFGLAQSRFESRATRACVKLVYKSLEELGI